MTETKTSTATRIEHGGASSQYGKDNGDGVQHAPVLTFELDVERQYRNKTGYNRNQKSINHFFNTEPHTAESFYASVVAQGWAFTMKHQKRTPQESGGILRNPKMTTPKHAENFTSLQVITGDDDRQRAGVLKEWRSDPFFSCYGSALVESVNSKPGAEKCHPTFILDRPITDYETAKLVLKALWCQLKGEEGLWPFMDSSIDPTNTIFNAENATIHRLDNILPLDVLMRDIVKPYQEKLKLKQERLESERAKYRAKLQKQKASGKSASDDVKRKKIQDYYDKTFRKLATLSNGRHNALIHAGSRIANIQATPWAALDIITNADSDAIQACKSNGYYNDHAGSDKEVLRHFHLGMSTNQTTSLDEPLVKAEQDDDDGYIIDAFSAQSAHQATSNDDDDASAPPPGKKKTQATPSAGKRRKALPIVLLKKKNARGEQGHAELLRLCFHNRVVYDNAQKTWYIWDGEKWLRDNTGAFHVLSANALGRQYNSFVAHLYNLASKATDDDEVKSLQAQGNAVIKTIRNLRGRRAIKNVLEWTQARQNLGIEGDEWDVAPGRLPCENGIVDLATGDFSPMTPGDYIQKMAPAKWEDLNATAPKWEQFIADIFNDDADLIAFVQRLLGYALLGEPREQIFPIFWGSGGNGKSTLCSVIEHVCGPLGGVAHKAIITQAGRASNPSTAQPYLMDLRGKRYAFVSETRKDIAIDEAQLKLVSGGDYITARYLNENPVTFAPTHTVFLLTNPKPKLDADDEAIWRRVFLVPFTQEFVRDIDPSRPNARKANPELAKELQAESSGILAWLVRGSMAYQKAGLVPPSAVLDATKTYREENDSFSVWLEENCETGDKARKVKSSAALKNYNEFCKDQGMEPLTAHAFRGKMKGLLGKAVKEQYGRYYYGIGVEYVQVKAPTEPETPPEAEPDSLPDIMFGPKE